MTGLISVSVDTRFHDKSWESVTIVGSNVYTDLAVIRVTDSPADTTPSPLQIAEHTAYPQPAQPVAALVNPLGLDVSITTGVVSSADRCQHQGDLQFPTSFK